MTSYKDIEGATDYVESLKKDFTTLESTIEELNGRKKDLEDVLGNTVDSYSIENIEKNSSTKHQLNLVNQYLKEANEQKEKLFERVNKTIAKDVEAITKKHVEEVRNKNNHINKEIVECLDKARQLQKQLDQEEVKEKKKIMDFIADLQPYCIDDDVFNKKHQHWGLKHFIEARVLYRRIFLTVPEPVYSVDGLLKPSAEARAKDTSFSKVTRATYDKLFGINPIKEQESK